MPRNTPKQTKKFITRHLKDTIERRKNAAKIKQRNQLKEKRKTRRAADNAKASDDEAPSDNEAKGAMDTSGAPALKDMSMDEFFAGGFETAATAANGTRKNASPSSKLGKRKRREEAETSQDGAQVLSSSADEQILEDSSDDGEQDNDSASEVDQVTEHKDELSALAEKDPEFYKYLKENDAELLDFAAGGETLILSDDEEPEGRPRKKGRNAGGGDDEEVAAFEVTVPMVKKWAVSMETQFSQAAMREMILAFRAAAHASESSEGQAFKYTIADAEAYHEVLTAALRGIPIVLAHHLPIKESTAGRVRVPTDSKKYRTLSHMLNSHAISISHLLESLSDTKAVGMVIKSLQPLIPYFLSFKKSLKNLVKAVINIWADPSSSEATRINSFLLLKRLAVVGDASLREAVLKSTYQGLVRSARNTTTHTLPGINLMKNSAAELWGLDPGLAYTTGFTYIRQLAIHLRTSITQPSKENYKAVYNWQYVHSLDFWSRVLSRSCSPAEILTLKKPADSPLHPLIYPLVQVTLGALRLVPSPIYFPLRFQLSRALLRISRTTDTYIPLAPSLLEVLQSPELKKPAKSSTLRPLDFDVSIRAPESYLRTRVYQDGLSEQLSELIAEFFGVWAKNIAFPELIIPPMTTIKRWLKEVSSFVTNKKSVKSSAKGGKGQGNRNGKANAHFSLLVQKLQANAQWVEQSRRKVDFAVTDRKGVESFLQDISFEDTPLGAYIMTIRRQKEERERLLQESRRDDERRRQEDRQASESEGSMAGEEVAEDSDVEIGDINEEGEDFGRNDDHDMESD